MATTTKTESEKPAKAPSAKLVRNTLKEAKKLLAYHRDLLKPEDASAFEQSIGEVRKNLADRDLKQCQAGISRLEEEAARYFPKAASGFREWVEIIAVAAIVAFGFRTFFLQPFKIPTGSMQPTLYGIYPGETSYLEDDNPSPMVQLFEKIAFGKVFVDGGYRTKGDHIFVDRLTYHFRRPTRGEVIVFDAEGIPGIVQTGKFYIKRLAGIGPEEIQIKAPYLYANGKRVEDEPFLKIYSMKCPSCGTVGDFSPETHAQNQAICHHCGMTRYHGYINPMYYPHAQYLLTPDDVFQIPADHYFALGDNSRSSSDSRFWGSFEHTRLVGRAVFMYWPFNERWGPIR
ncbi:MAG: signal peptidase I [Verrucomicrobiota bacterium]|nr:signal peptidase I [Verrucomicrobiota bacterium]